MAEPTSFISVAYIERLFKLLTSIRDARRDEIVRIGDVFGDPRQLARFYVEPRCQHHNPADRHEDLEPVSQVRAPAFEVINDFLRGDFTPLGDGRTQMFILSDAGMGKTSLLMMIRLMHLMAFWPCGYDCLLLKLGQDALQTIAAHPDKAGTVLLLDALDEDPLAWGAIESRLVALLDATAQFRRVILSCRTQFFPETGSDSFGRPGRVEVGGYTCPMVFLSPFDDAQVDAYLRKRFPDRWHQRLLMQENPERQRAAKVIGSMQSLRFRPLLLAHIRDVVDAGEGNWNPYSLYQALVDRWLDREERKLRRQYATPPSKETLWHVCSAVALHMQTRGDRLLSRQELDRLTTGFPELASLEHFDVGGRSLLNRTAAGDFRFSHYSIQEFLVVHALATETAEKTGEPLRATAQMLEFLAYLPRVPALDGLDLTGLQPSALAGFSFQDRLSDGSLGPRMQLIPSGTFLMGSADKEWHAEDNEKPQHPVTITQMFALGRLPVTFEEYDRFAASAGRKRPNDVGSRGRSPVINVSWGDAVAYCDWLSQQTGQSYRLPTEAEWEYTRRAGNKTHILEWVEDVWHDTYKGAPADGAAWTDGEGKQSSRDRVIRGGFGRFYSYSGFRSASRIRNQPDSRGNNLGFRVARTHLYQKGVVFETEWALNSSLEPDARCPSDDGYA